MPYKIWDVEKARAMGDCPMPLKEACRTADGYELAFKRHFVVIPVK
jgi:hypothetical protein